MDEHFAEISRWGDEDLGRAVLAGSGLGSAIASLESLFAAPPPPVVGQRFLRFQLCPESTALLGVEDVVTVVPVAIANILPVPHMPDFVLGLYNWRGEMLWLIDLGSQVGFAPLWDAGSFTIPADRQRQSRERHRSNPGDSIWPHPHLNPGETGESGMAIVVQMADQTLGLVISQVYDIEEHVLETLQPPSIGLFPPKLIPFVQGYLIDEDSHPTSRYRSTVLNLAAIFQDTRLQVHQCL